MEKVLVTGGLGFIGRALSEKLRDQGYDVRILDNRLRGDEKYLDGGTDAFDIHIGDIRDPSVVESAVKGCDKVFHLAAINGTKNFYNIPRQVFEVGVVGTHLLLDAAIKEEIGEFLFMSSSEVYQTPKEVPTDESAALFLPDPINARYSYGGSKIAGEIMTVNYCRDAMDKAVIVRPHNVYGPNMGYDHVVPELALKILHAYEESGSSGPVEVPLEGDGEATRAFVYVDDFVDGALMAMDKGEHLNIYHVGTEDEVSILELAKRIAQQLGIETNFVQKPAAPGGTMRRCPDISKMRALGYQPQIPLDRGLDAALTSVRIYFENREK